MNNKVEYEQFVADSFYHKRGRFRYDRNSFSVRRGVKVRILCLKHGWFEQTSSNHRSNGAGCPACGRESNGRRFSHTKSDILRRISQLNLDKNYTVVDVDSNQNGKVIIGCAKHNNTYSLPIKSLLHSGCIGCRVCNNVSLRHETVADMFLLSKGRFKILTTTKSEALPLRVKGWCVKHGEFEAEKVNIVKPGSWGCPACSSIAGGAANHKRRRISVCQATADLLHIVGGKYRILGGVELDGDVLFRLECPLHGEFSLPWRTTIGGYFKKTIRFGCPVCGKKLRTERYSLNTHNQRRDKFLNTATTLNPHLRVTGVFNKVVGEVEVTCSKGHVTVIPAARLLDKRHGTICEVCCGKSGSSRAEVAIGEMLELFNVRFIHRDRKLLNGKELDFFLPDHNIAIEYNGALWHSERYQTDKLRSNNKRLQCKSMGVRLLNLCSSIPLKLCLSIVANAVGINNESYHARKCEVIHTDSDSMEQLFIDTHVQGSVTGCHMVGLKHNGVIVAAMAFSMVSSERGTKFNSHRWELRRFASYGRVAGGASKLLKAFISATPECREVISYSDNSIFDGSMYEALGFKLLHETQPDYKYTRNGQRVIHKSTFQRSRLAKNRNFVFDPNLSERENCYNNKWYRIWDCGKKKWSMMV